MMTQDQRVAIAAHEFVHVRERDNRYDRLYSRLPPALVWVAIGVWALSQADPSSGIVLLIVAIPLAFIYAPFWLKVAAAKHYRERELRCDMVAAQYVDGEALISALSLADPILNPPGVRDTRTCMRWLSHTSHVDLWYLVRRTPENLRLALSVPGIWMYPYSR
jgi:Peptidase family M48